MDTLRIPLLIPINAFTGNNLLFCSAHSRSEIVRFHYKEPEQEIELLVYTVNRYVM